MGARHALKPRIPLYDSVSCKNAMPANKKHPIVKQTYPLYDSAGAKNAIPANKNAPNRKVDTLF